MKIFFDIDGVLSSFEANVIQVANELWPDAPLPPNYRPRDWDYSDVFSKDQWDIIWKKIGATSDFWLRAPEIEHNVSALRTWLKNTEHDVYYITSRQDTGGMMAGVQTAQWLARHGLYPYFARLIVVQSPLEKKKYIEQYRIDYGIDDLPATVNALNDLSWHRCYLLSQPWNESSNQDRVSSVQEFLDIVDSAGRS